MRRIKNELLITLAFSCARSKFFIRKVHRIIRTAKMDLGIVIAIITSATSIVVVAMSFMFDRHKDRDSDWRKIKLEHYREFFFALSAIAERNSSCEDQKRFSQASNTVQLVASKEVIDALHYFREYIYVGNAENHSLGTHEELLSRLVRAVRRDLGMSSRANPVSTTVRLWNSG